MSKGKMKIKNKTGGSINLKFDPMFAVKSVRRPMPPAPRVEQPVKGKGSYSRKAKHKKKYSSEDDSSTSFLLPKG